MKELKIGQVVQHKLTKEHLLVLNHGGYGGSYVDKTRVRTMDLRELFLDTDELEPLDRRVLRPC